MNLVELDHALRKLRLSGMADVVEARLRQAQTEKLAPLDLVAIVGFVAAWGGYAFLVEHTRHGHVSLNRRMNAFYAAWVSVFYGYPTFAWVPTHNLNHHKHVNRAGDATITWRHTNRNTWWIAVSYFFASPVRPERDEFEVMNASGPGNSGR